MGGCYSTPQNSNLNQTKRISSDIDTLKVNMFKNNIEKNKKILNNLKNELIYKIDEIINYKIDEIINYKIDEIINYKIDEIINYKIDDIINYKLESINKENLNDLKLDLISKINEIFTNKVEKFDIQLKNTNDEINIISQKILNNSSIY